MAKFLWNIVEIFAISIIRLCYRGTINKKADKVKKYSKTGKNMIAEKLGPIGRVFQEVFFLLIKGC